MDEQMTVSARVAYLMAENGRKSELLAIERKLHAETHRKLEKADHDRQRYARRIRFLQDRHEILAREYSAIRKERDILKTALTACERMLRDAET